MLGFVLTPRVPLQHQDCDNISQSLVPLEIRKIETGIRLTKRLDEGMTCTVCLVMARRRTPSIKPPFLTGAMAFVIRGNASGCATTNLNNI
jgi:hypothetical protein